MNPADWVVRERALGGPLPQGSGFEAAGVVSAVGADVEDTTVGDLVFGNLAFGGATAGRRRPRAGHEVQEAIKSGTAKGKTVLRVSA
jgi:NADPH:quinone reductase-like Zn-dependent oxidoreductase